MNKKNIRIAVGSILRYVVKYDPILAIAIFSLIVALTVPLFLRLRGLVEADSGNRLLMGTFARIVAVAADSGTARKCIEAGFEQLELVNNSMSDYEVDSQLSRVNRRAYEGAVKVSEPLFEVLQRSVAFSRETNGAFDVTVGPVVDLFRSAAEANSVPTDAELAEVRSRVGYEKLILDANEMSVRFAADGMRLDLGGIAKGYAIDKATEAMQSCGAIGGMVDVGGDIRCFGVPAGSKENWLIGLQDPNDTKEVIGTGKTLLVLKLSNAAIATSGDYRRFALIEGRKYSHIIDTKTGCSSGGLASVTIISKSATDADALATAVSVMGIEKGLALIESKPQTEAILITAQHRLIKTSGAGKYIK